LRRRQRIGDGHLTQPPTQQTHAQQQRPCHVFALSVHRLFIRLD
jgi:hypothetical protein